MNDMLVSGQTEGGEEQNFFDIKEIVHNEFVLSVQTVNSTYYCGALRRLRENMQRLCPELWRQKKTDCCITITHHFTFPFCQGLSGQKKHECCSHPLYFSPFLRLKMKLKGGHFDTTEMIEAESQAVLNTLTETTSRMHLKTRRSSGNGAYSAEMAYLEGDHGY
jgi:hypothetical protein